ncbi:MAG: hypothetical protein AVDCRST_MAG11-1974, partial [uncultured Gemmatimonadaceae bacterium]
DRSPHAPSAVPRRHRARARRRGRGRRARRARRPARAPRRRPRRRRPHRRREEGVRAAVRRPPDPQGARAARRAGERAGRPVGAGVHRDRPADDRGPVREGLPPDRGPQPGRVPRGLPAHPRAGRGVDRHADQDAPHVLRARHRRDEHGGAVERGDEGVGDAQRVRL